MDSLNYACEEKGLLFTDDTDFQFNSLMEYTARFSSSTTNDEKLLAPMERRLSLDHSQLSPPEGPVSAKRTRMTNQLPQIPTCQVHGCNKDLSSLKDYYKRHKVCDVHSKTAVVVVNGIQQRFCQQCSRFHVLSEFDEGKRSCRRRLAGHNQRRRKPQFHPHLGPTYFTMNEAKASLLFSGLLPGGLLGLKHDKPSKGLRLEDDPGLVSPIRYDPKSVLCLHSTWNQQHPSPSSVPELYVGPNSRCALSLLSAQSHNSAHPVITRAQNSVDFTEPLEKSMSQGRLALAPPFEVVEKGVPLISCPGVSSEGVNTVGLLELSLNLQRVEQQKYYTQIQPETGILLPRQC